MLSTGLYHITLSARPPAMRPFVKTLRPLVFIILNTACMTCVKLRPQTIILVTFRKRVETYKNSTVQLF